MRSSLLYLDTPGSALRIVRGRLAISPHGGFHSPGSHALGCIVLAASGYVTTDALSWLSREHVGLLVVRPPYEAMAVTAAISARLARAEIALRRAQMETVFDDRRRVAAARGIVGLKLKTLGLAPDIKMSVISPSSLLKKPWLWLI